MLSLNIAKYGLTRWYKTITRQFGCIRFIEMWIKSITRVSERYLLLHKVRKFRKKACNFWRKATECEVLCISTQRSCKVIISYMASLCHRNIVRLVQNRLYLYLRFQEPSPIKTTEISKKQWIFIDLKIMRLFTACTKEIK